jgi:hypothetical protein
LANGNTATDGRFELKISSFAAATVDFTTVGPVFSVRSMRWTPIVAHLIVDIARDHNATRLGERLQPRRHVDAVAIDIVVIADDVADIDSNAELDAALGRYLDIALDHPALNVDGATNGVDDADKFHQHPVAGGLDDPTPVLGDFGINQFLAMRLQLSKGSLFVNAHQLAVASNVGRQNRGKPPVNASLNHKIFLSG